MVTLYSKTRVKCARERVLSFENSQNFKFLSLPAEASFAWISSIQRKMRRQHTIFFSVEINIVFQTLQFLIFFPRYTTMFEQLREPGGARALLIGDYDWKFLCMPRFPFFNKKKEYNPPPFYAHDESLSLFVSLMIGLQHALTMSTNIITPAILVFNVVMSYFPDIYDPALGEEQAANRERALDVAQYLVSASLICSGLCTMVQVSTIPIPFTKGRYQLGTGVLSTMGTANQYNAIFPVILYDIMSRGYDIEEAWGKLLGTIMVVGQVDFFLLALILERFTDNH